MIGKTALGLRSDYLAIATLGIAEIIVVMNNEDSGAWCENNKIAAQRPSSRSTSHVLSFVANANAIGIDPVTATLGRTGYSVLITIVLVVIFRMAQAALKSPLGSHDARDPRQ